MINNPSEAHSEAGHSSPIVLVVEDDELIRMVTVELLIDLGYQVLEAEDGASAFRILETETVDLLMTDVRLPDGSGADLATRAVASRPDLKVMIASGYDRPSVAAGSIPEKSVWLQKPFDEKRLSEALREVGAAL